MDTYDGEVHPHTHRESQTEKWYEFMVKHAHLTMWEYDICRRRISIVVPASKKFQMPTEFENVPESIVPYIAERSVADFLHMYEEIQAGKSEVTCNVWFNTDMTIVPHCERIIYTVEHDEKGQAVHALGIAQDITAQMLADEQYKRAIEIFLADSNRFQYVVMLDLTHNTVKSRKRKGKASGIFSHVITYDGLVERYAKIFYAPVERQSFLQNFSREAVLKAFQLGKFSFSLKFRSRTGKRGIRWFSLSYQAAQNPVTGDIEVLAYTQDIHTQVLMEKIIATLTHSNLECISIIDLARDEYHYISHNQYAEHILPMKTTRYDDEIRYIAEQLVVPEMRADYWANISLAGVLDHLQHADYYTYGVSLYDRSGRFCRKMLRYDYLDETRQYILMTAIDTTDTYQQISNQMEQIQDSMQRERQAVDSKREFLSTISHDMRTPLNGIIGFTELAMASPLGEKTQEYLQKIKVSGYLLLDLINDTLMLSKLESGKLVPQYEIIDNRTISTRILIPVEEAAKRKNITFVADRSKSPQVLVKADRINTQKIFLNLLSNAVKFTPAGGCVEIHMEQLQEKMYDCNFRFIVRDTGIGMSAEFLERMYEPFSQEQSPAIKNDQGTGLGLTIVKKLVDLLHGHMDVKSEVGKGTEFTIFLQLDIVTGAEARAAANKSALHLSKDVWMPADSSILPDIPVGKADTCVLEEYEDESDTGRPVILLCEDNALNTEIAMTILNNRGYNVVCAANGQEGAEIFAASQIGRFSAILMDLRMPILNGYEATKRIRSLHRPDALRIPIIAMSADAFEEDRQNSREAGMNEHLPKPIDPDLLYVTLEKFIDSTTKT